MPTEEQLLYNNRVRLPRDVTRMGQKLTIPNRTISSLSFVLSRETFWGDPPGHYVYFFTIRRVSDGVVIANAAMGWYGALTATPTWITGALTPITINEEVRISVECTTGTSNQYMYASRQLANVKADEEHTYWWEGAWVDVPGWDMAYKYDWSAPIVLPTITTDPATSVQSDGATLNGTLVADGGEACDCGFEWGETPAYGNTTPTQSRTTGQTFAQPITGLDPRKTYHFRALATNATGAGYGADRTFTTLAAAPTVNTDPATDITNAAAALNGELTYDGGEACDCGFEWGLTVAYGNTTPTQSRATGQTFSQPISGLAANTPYHFRAFATNSSGTSYGPDRTFNTLAAAPLVTTDPATGLGAVLATVNGTLDNDIGEPSECGFEWGLDTGYGALTPTEIKTTGETFSQPIHGLQPNTTYHFRALATNSSGTGFGTDRSFTTKLVISRAYALSREEL